MRAQKELLHLYRDPKRFRALILFLVSLSSLGSLIYFTQPTSLLVILFHILVFFNVFFLATALLNGARHGLVIGSGVVLYFFLQFLDLRHPLYPILIAATIISLELYLRKR